MIYSIKEIRPDPTREAPPGKMWFYYHINAKQPITGYRLGTSIDLLTLFFQNAVDRLNAIEDAPVARWAICS